MSSTITPAKEWAIGKELSFAYRIHHPSGVEAETIVFLHGSGVDETSMIPFAAEIEPAARLIAVRGRIEQDGGTRWFTRITPTEFDQASITAEAEAFVNFTQELASAENFTISRAIFLGYSNGANLLSSAMLLHPGLIGRAVLLRSMPVLHHPPAADLLGTQVLVIAGAADVTYGPYAPALVSLLSSRGAEVDARIVPAGHEFGSDDTRIVRQWIEAHPASPEIA